MNTPNSPLFPPASLTLAEESSTTQERAYIPTLPEKPISSTSSLEVYLIPAEKNLFIEGFSACEYADRPPTLLRGCLYVRVLKPTKIKNITLSFKGSQRTDWPEGIPPKKTQYAEINDIVSHTWPFYQSGTQLPKSVNGGADHYQELPRTFNESQSDLTISHLSLAETQARSLSPLPVRKHADSVGSSHLGNGGATGSIGDFFARTISLSPVAAGLMKRSSAKDSPTRSPSPTPSSSSISLVPTATGASLTESLNPVQTENGGAGQFAPGDYIYNFEHPIPASTPESCKVTFGEVAYHLEYCIARPGTFKSNLTGRLPINIVRIPSEDNLEENEPIVITRDWEDQLKYDIVIGSKSVVLNSYLPLAFRFVPLWGKVALHRIRVYISENSEYYCNNKKVHRMEPPRKYLLLEHKAVKGKSLLSKSGGLKEDANSSEPKSSDKISVEEDEALPRELEFQVYVPQTLEDKAHHSIHPDTSFPNIQSHHWIKICLRISRNDPENPEKRKHYEIRIDSPINILSPLCVHANTLLPEYNEFEVIPEADENFPVYSVDTPPVSPGVIPIGNSVNNSFINGVPGNSLDALMDTSEFSRMGRQHAASISRSILGNSVSRSSSPHVQEFQHINSSYNNDEPIERDLDMHLEANIYKPDENLEARFHSPQAMPYDSPVGSPMMRPIHVLRKPSINPPAFHEISGPPILVAPPPKYQEEDPSANDAANTEDEVHEEHLRRGRRRTQDSNFEPISTSNSQEDESSSAPTENSANSATNDISEASSTTTTAQPSSNFKVTPATPVESPVTLPAISVPPTSEISPLSPRVIPEDDEQDIVDVAQFKDGPIEPPVDNYCLSPKLRARSRSRSRSRHASRSPSPSTAPRQSSDFSRKSSLTSMTSLTSSVGGIPTAPIERMHLLNESQSTTSLEQTTSHNHPISYPRTSNSIISLLQNDGISGKKQSIGSGDFGTDDLHGINGNLLSLRNPRIKKHYQDEDEPRGANLKPSRVDTSASLRQKSFGVIDNQVTSFSGNANSSESDNTSTEDGLAELTTYKSKDQPPPQEVAGLNMNYIIE